MTKLNEIYKCEVCGNITEVLHTGAGELVCCGQPMKLMEAKAKDEGQEKPSATSASVKTSVDKKVMEDKHLPVIKELPADVCQGKDGAIITVGEVEHPMEETHYIEWIEVIAEDGKRGKRFLKPGDKPQAEFYTRKKIIGARAYCNVHGLWEITL